MFASRYQGPHAVYVYHWHTVEPHSCIYVASFISLTSSRIQQTFNLRLPSQHRSVGSDEQSERVGTLKFLQQWRGGPHEVLLPSHRAKGSTSPSSRQCRHDAPWSFLAASTVRSAESSGALEPCGVRCDPLQPPRSPTVLSRGLTVQAQTVDNNHLISRSAGPRGSSATS